MKTYSLAPVDAWFFRDGRPHNEKEANQADVVSVFPPPARTLSGALRAALARANGWTGRGSWSQPLNRAFGSGPEELGGLQFTGPLLILNDEALWPLPRHVLGRVGCGENWEPRAFLRPAEAATACDAGDIRLPEIVATKGDASRRVEECGNSMDHREGAGCFARRRIAGGALHRATEKTLGA